MAMPESKEFDIAVSFAGAERAYAQAIFSILEANGLKVFLDEAFQAEIWGTNLVEYLSKLYRDRADYCLMMISDEYKRRAYTKVERRAALDRFIQESGEYILPVKIDDSWIEGLPQATAYQDLRIKGVVGICDLIVRKIQGAAAPTKIVIPKDLRIPRVPAGTIPWRVIQEYLLEHCKRERVAVFAALIYDEGSAELRKLLRDPDYWDALDRASGPHFEVFSLKDKVEVGYEYDSTIKLLTAVSFDQAQSKSYRYSRLLKEYFGVPKTLISYPTMLLFLVEGNRVTHFRNIPLKAGNIEETFGRMRALFSSIATSLDAWLGQGGDSDALWAILRETLLKEGYTIYKKQRPDMSAERSMSELAKFAEQPSSEIKRSS